jgi:hypothetical protein
MKHIMKTCLPLLAATLILGTSLFTAFAANKDTKVTPKGGLRLDKSKPTAELVVEKDRRVTIHFYNDEMKSVPATGQIVTLIADAKGGKATLEFEKQGDTLVSKTKLPDGEGYNIVVQFKNSPEHKPHNTRFVLDLHVCGGCKRPEYGCTCGH